MSLFFLMVICFFVFLLLFIPVMFFFNLKTEIQEKPKLRHVFKVFLLIFKKLKFIYLFLYSGKIIVANCYG